MEHETKIKNRSDQIFIEQSFISFKNSYQYFSSLFMLRRTLFLIAINLQLNMHSSTINSTDNDGRTSSIQIFLSLSVIFNRFTGTHPVFPLSVTQPSVQVFVSSLRERETFVRISSSINQSDEEERERERERKKRERKEENSTIFFIDQSAEKQVQQGIIRVLSHSHTHKMIEFYHSVLSDFFHSHTSAFLCLGRCLATVSSGI